MEREGRGCRGWAGRHHANCHALSRSHCHAAELSQLPAPDPGTAALKLSACWLQTAVKVKQRLDAACDL